MLGRPAPPDCAVSGLFYIEIDRPMNSLLRSSLASGLLLGACFFAVGCSSDTGTAPKTPEEGAKAMESDMQNMSKTIPSTMPAEANPPGGAAPAENK